MAAKTHRVLAGDIGGTHTRLALYDVNGLRLKALAAQTYPSGQYNSLESIIHEFLNAQQHSPQAACLGVAGPVHRQTVDITNLPWQVSAAELAGDLGLEGVYLLNDLEATGWGIRTLQDDDLFLLQPGDPQATGNAAIIAAGTGLGQAGLYCDGDYLRPFACEGGHSDFSPQSDLDMALLRYLQRQHTHVSWERVVSGSGLVSLHACLCELRQRDTPGWLQEAMQAGDAAAAISTAAQQGKDQLCVEALQWFIHLYGMEAGNLALKLMASGGLYVAGGIAPKILDPLSDGTFTGAFCAKGRMRALMERIPVRVILNGDTALQGAALRAALHCR